MQLNCSRDPPLLRTLEADRTLKPPRSPLIVGQAGEGLGMREISVEEYMEFLKQHGEVTVEGQRIPLGPIKVRRLTPLPKELTDVSTTVWSFPKRGSWATHKGDYRGNWPPQIPRALMLMYTKPGDVVLDQMMGSGTTLVEAKLLGRNAIGVDINLDAAMLAMHRLYHLEKALEEHGGGATLEEYLGFLGGEDASLDAIRRAWFRVYVGDARSLNKIEDESIDLIATHPPYFNIIRYSRSKERVEGDLSRARSLEEYLSWMRSIARESYRVLKPGKHCAILVGDTRVGKHYVPITHHVLRVFLEEGFILREEIVKIQHKMKTTREFWIRRRRDFLLIYHEKLYIFRKPLDENDRRKYRYSTLT